MSKTSDFDYKRYLNLVRQHKTLFLVAALAVMTVTVIVSYLLPEKYEAKSTVFIEKTLINELVKGFAVTPSMEDKIKGLTYAMGSRPLLQKVVADLNLNGGRADALIAQFQKDTKVELKDKEGLFTISYSGENPKLARDYVNALVKRYIEENSSSTRAESYGASKFLSEQIAAMKEKLDKADAEVSRFRMEKGPAAAADPAALEREISMSQQRIDEIQLRKAQLEATRSQLKKHNPAQLRLLALEKRLEEMRVEYTDRYPEVMRLKSEIESLREQALTSSEARPGGAELQELERVEAELRVLRSAEAKQYAGIASARAMLRTIPSARAQLEQLEREKASQKQVYDQLVARHGQSEFSKRMEAEDKGTTFRVVDPAVLPIQPTSPNRVAIILMGIGGGIVAGFGLVLLLDYYDESVKSLDGLKGLGLPVLAVIPKMRVPVEIQQEKAYDARLYAISACYFSLILIVLLLELLQVPLFSSSIDSLQLKQYFSQAVGQFK
ncbi:XrtA system polysaccharide chain length determinant [Geotalea sp. SG265]|uniref:XrtA system polysaccharide chain length determinant n=1 Tax=Geotalea sp. SG265 TaxID=2922867 RepID=UPI001FB005BA|nr:XrtA system polysaccharide chain length determinant [Geotalea sp. SG265]